MLDREGRGGVHRAFTAAGDCLALRELWKPITPELSHLGRVAVRQLPADIWAGYLACKWSS